MDWALFESVSTAIGANLEDLDSKSLQVVGEVLKSCKLTVPFHLKATFL